MNDDFARARAELRRFDELPQLGCFGRIDNLTSRQKLYRSATLFGIDIWGFAVAQKVDAIEKSLYTCNRGHTDTRFKTLEQERGDFRVTNIQHRVGGAVRGGVPSINGVDSLRSAGLPRCRHRLRLLPKTVQR